MSESVAWTDRQRALDFDAWLARIAPAHQLRPESLRMASADASFRRYLRIDADGQACSRIIMDAPPDKENCAPFVQVAELMAQAGVRAPQVLDWDREHGFLLLTDLGRRTLLDVLDPARPEAALPFFLEAIDALVRWQRASRPRVLPPYDEALLRRELALFPDWYIARHRGITLDAAQRQTLDRAFDLIVQHNLASASVYVHRDYMPRNLMLADDGGAALGACRTWIADSENRPQRAQFLPDLQPHSPAMGQKAGEKWVAAVDLQPATSKSGRLLGVLDFQDAVHGPVTYDIASLMRDAFLSWEEEFVLDVTVRYWEAARKASLPVDEDFGSFYRAVEWMGLQRHLKVAGIFARLTLRDGKAKYLADAPRFIGYIRATAGRYRELAPLLRLVDTIENITPASGYIFGRP